jgi:hypothetical protein
MNAQAAIPLTCPNGHGRMPGGSRFCFRCGSTLVVQPAPLAAPRPAVPIPPAAHHAPNPNQFPPPVACHHCGGNGQRLAPDVVVCPQCRWLRPLAPE